MLLQMVLAVLLSHGLAGVPPARASSLELVGQIAVGSRTVASVVALPAGSATVLTVAGTVPSTRENPDQVLSTTIQDPANPEEPWVVTTYRRSGESLTAFIQRHRQMVDAVRDELDGG